MKNGFLTIIAVTSMASFTAGAAEVTEEGKKAVSQNHRQGTSPANDSAGAPDMDAIREELKDLTREERAAKLKEYRDQYSGTQATEEEKNRERFAQNWKSMSKEERTAHLQRMQKEHRSKSATPEQRAEQLRLAQASLDKQIKTLQTKKTVGTITPRESDVLVRLLSQRRQVNARIKSAEFRKSRVPPASTPNGK